MTSDEIKEAIIRLDGLIMLAKHDSDRYVAKYVSYYLDKAQTILSKELEEREKDA